MFWTRKHQIESSNHEGFFKNFPCRRQFLQEFYKVQTNFVGFFHARCLNFPCFITYLAACMHACILHVLSVGLTREETWMAFELFKTLFTTTDWGFIVNARSYIETIEVAGYFWSLGIQWWISSLNKNVQMENSKVRAFFKEQQAEHEVCDSSIGLENLNWT